MHRKSKQKKKPPNNNLKSSLQHLPTTQKSTNKANIRHCMTKAMYPTSPSQKNKIVMIFSELSILIIINYISVKTGDAEKPGNSRTIFFCFQLLRLFDCLDHGRFLVIIQFVTTCLWEGLKIFLIENRYWALVFGFIGGPFPAFFNGQIVLLIIISVTNLRNFVNRQVFSF